MWEDILSLAIKNGIWAVLFVALLLFVLKDSSNREKKYIQTINELSEHLGVVNDIKEEVKDIKNHLSKTTKKFKEKVNTDEFEK